MKPLIPSAPVLVVQEVRDGWKTSDGGSPIMAGLQQIRGSFAINTILGEMAMR